jgi:hypothetical protein
MLRNAKDRLNIPQADRLEQAWRRVLLEQWSRRQIVEICGVADGTVAHMRRVMERGREQSKIGAEFRHKLGGRSLHETSWALAKLAYVGVEPTAADDELDAARLARRINARLSQNPEVTARALELRPRVTGEAQRGMAGAERLHNDC